MNEHTAKRILAAAATCADAAVGFTRHAEERMRERGVTRTQILRILQRGIVTEGPYEELSFPGWWKCNVRGVAAGQDITVVAAFEINTHGDRVTVVTAIVH